MKKIDPFCDSILGKWKPDKERTTKENYAWFREATLKLDEQYAQDYFDPETKKPNKIFGEVTLTEMKFINKQTSDVNFSRKITPTNSSVIKPVI